MKFGGLFLLAILLKNKVVAKNRKKFTKRFLRSTNIKLLEINKNDNKYTIDTIVYLKKKFKQKNLFG